MAGKTKSPPVQKASLFQSLFASTEISSRAIELADGSESEFHFREITAKELQMYRRLYHSPDPLSQSRAVPYLISVAVCDESGNPVLTEDNAGRLKGPIADQFSSAALDVSGFGDKKKSDRA